MDLNNLIYYLIPVISLFSIALGMVWLRQLSQLESSSESIEALTGFVGNGIRVFVRRQFLVSALIVGLLIVASLVSLVFHIHDELFILFLFLGYAGSAGAGYLAVKAATAVSGRSLTDIQSNKFPVASYQGAAVTALFTIGIATFDIWLWITILDWVANANLAGISSELMGRAGLHGQAATDHLGSTEFVKAKYLQISKVLMAYGAGVLVQSVFGRMASGLLASGSIQAAYSISHIDPAIGKNDLRNPAAVGSEVGLQAQNSRGSSSILYESYVVSVLGATALAAVSVATHPGITELHLVFVPLILGALGLVTIPVSFLFIKRKGEQILRNHWGGAGYAWLVYLLLAGILTVIQVLPGLVLACVAGTMLFGVCIHYLSVWFTAPEHGTVKRIQAGASISSFTPLLFGLGRGTTGGLLVTLLAGILITKVFFIKQGNAFFNYGLFGIAVAGVVLVAMTLALSARAGAAVTSEFAESGSQMLLLDQETKQRSLNQNMVNTTQTTASHNLTLVGSLLTLVSLIYVYVESIGIWLSRLAGDGIYYWNHLGFTNLAKNVSQSKHVYLIRDLSHIELVELMGIDILNPVFLKGVLTGAALCLAVLALVINGSGAVARHMAEAAKEEYQKTPDIRQGTQLPDYGMSVAIGARHAQIWTGCTVMLLVILPMTIGLVLGLAGLVGIMLGFTVISVLLGLIFNFSGAAWAVARRSYHGSESGGEGSVHAIQSLETCDGFGMLMREVCSPVMVIAVKLFICIAIIFGSFALIVGH
jgi:K(+)-stimulated pyrophosphate-energized sodium pump